jgi:molybdate transport system permease protein
MVAGYTPGRTATISTTVYQLWRTGDDLLAYRWVAVNIAISFVVLIAINFFGRKLKSDGNRARYAGLA